MLYNERVSQLLCSLSSNGKAAWAECALLAQVVRKRVGNRDFKNRVITDVCGIGWYMSDADRMDEFLKTGALLRCDNTAHLCRKAIMDIKSGRVVDWQLTKEEYILFTDIIQSNLFREIAIYLRNVQRRSIHVLMDAVVE